MANEKQLLIEVRDKIATLKSKNFNLVGGNNDYDVVFDFDDDWQNYLTKTAVFVYGNEKPVYKLVEGNICEGVAINNATMCLIGVFAGDIRTTTPAMVECIYRSILDEARGTPQEPTEDVYNQIMELLDKAIQAHTELPTGGKTGQVLKKKSDEDYDTQWEDDEVRDLSDYLTKDEGHQTFAKNLFTADKDRVKAFDDFNAENNNSRPFNQELYDDLIAMERVYVEDDNYGGVNSLYALSLSRNYIPYNPWGFYSAEECGDRPYIEKTDANGVTTYHPAMGAIMCMRSDGNAKVLGTPVDSRDVVPLGFADQNYPKWDNAIDGKYSIPIKTRYGTKKWIKATEYQDTDVEDVSIPIRHKGGVLKTAYPQSSADATNKDYVDTITAKKLAEIDKADWVEDNVPQEWIDTEISKADFPYSVEGIGKLQKTKGSGFAYDFGRAYNRVYVERSGDGWGGHGGGQYAKFALTQDPVPVPDPDYKDWEKDENGNVIAPKEGKFNSSIPIRLPDTHIRVPANASDYEKVTGSARRMQALSLGAYEDKTVELKAEIYKKVDEEANALEEKTNEISEKLNNTASAVKTMARSALLVLDDLASNAFNFKIKANPNTEVIVTAPNLSSAKKLSSSGSTNWLAAQIVVFPPKNSRITLSCDFENIGGTRVGLAIKPDDKSVVVEPQSSESSGSLTTTVNVGNYSRHVALRFYSNYSNNDIDSNCNFTNIVCKIEGIETDADSYNSVQTKYIADDNGDIMATAPEYSPVVVYSLGGGDISVEYSVDIGKHFATKDELSAIPKFDIKVVTSLPTSYISTTTLYLLNSYSYTNNLYEEYIYVDGKWELLGTAIVDLTDYVKSASLAKVATSGSYVDLSNKPTIPVVSQTLTQGSTNAISSGAVYNALLGKVDANTAVQWGTETNMSGKSFTTGVWYLKISRNDSRFPYNIYDSIGIIEFTLGSIYSSTIYMPSIDRELIIDGGDGSWRPVKRGTTEVDVAGGFTLYATKIK